NQVKVLLAESPRFPAPRASAQGESAPKTRARAVVDGKRVNIPAPTNDAMGGRRRLCRPGVGCPGSSVLTCRVGKSAWLSRGVLTRAGLSSLKCRIPCFQEKPLSFSRWTTVPQTDTGGRAEYAQALERTQEKELGKLKIGR